MHPEGYPPLGSHHCQAGTQTWREALSWLWLRAGNQHPEQLHEKLCRGRHCSHSSPPAPHLLLLLAGEPVSEVIAVSTNPINASPN